MGLNEAPIQNVIHSPSVRIRQNGETGNLTYKKLVLQRLEELLSTADEVASSVRTDTGRMGMSYIGDHALFAKWATSCLNLLERVFGKDGSHYRNFVKIHEKCEPLVYPVPFERIRGILEAAKEDFEGGYLFKLESLVTAEVFADFLEMADHLLSEGYKDPAAVLIGGVLEEHLRKLCTSNGVDVAWTDAKGTTRPKKADRMNADLARQGVYNKLDQKNVTAWLDLRNKAAHGHYDQYTQGQVELMSSGVRDFVTRNPP